MRILITAGPTCEDLDDVRFITNRSTGLMGFLVAAEAIRRGHSVDLVSGPTHLATPQSVKRVDVRSAEELLVACQALFPGCDALVAAAAVSDYRPERRISGKMKKGPGELSLRLVRTPDVAAALGRVKRAGQLIVGFALEATDIFESRSSAEAKFADKKQDMAVLNGPEAMGAAGAAVSFYTAGLGWRGPELLGKEQVAARILDFLEERLGTAR